MGPGGHVHSDQPPVQQGQPIYSDSPAYDHLFPRANQLAASPWDQFNPNNSNILPQSSATQAWHQGSLPHRYNSPQQPYQSANSPYQPTSSYSYTQYNGLPGQVNNFGHPPAVDPALSQDPAPPRAQQQSPYQPALRTLTPQGQPTVSPQALQQHNVQLSNSRPASSPYQMPKATNDLFSQRVAPTLPVAPPVSNPKYDLPKGKWSGGFYVVDQAALAKATNSKPLNKFLTIGIEPLYLATNRTALPTYNPRQSVKDLKKAGAGRKKVLDKTVRRPSKAFLLSRPSPGKAGPPTLQRDVEDSESYSETDDDSEYTSDEEEEESPLPASRPDEPHQAVRYDVIKSSWFARNDAPSPEKIKASLAELWEVLNTIQKRWRADSKAVTEAEEQKKTGELPVLRSRVKGQRDLLQCALESALEFTHPDILHNLGRVKPFLYLCYQFLANRFKLQDYDGALSAAIYKVLARAGGTLTTELIEETKLIKALNSMKKSANAANKLLIQQIIEAAAAGSKKPKVNSPPRDEAADSKTAKRPAPSQPAGRPTAESPVAKKLKTAEPSAGTSKKPVLSESGAKTATGASSAPQKRPGEKPSAATAKPRVSQVVNKPSSFFSTLSAASKKTTPTAATASAAKSNTQSKAGVTPVKDKKPTPAAKPGFSFADTMALLEPKKEVKPAPKPEKQAIAETPEQKAKRLRKESRRHLRVSFRPDATLVDIRYFSHDPDEEQGHDENFVRDAGDIGGEGRMFKQHRDMVDEDDEDETDMKFVEWRAPTEIDFGKVADAQHRYDKYAGGLKKPDSPEKEANLRREASTLCVDYTRPSDIPPSPREPTETPPERTEPVKEFGLPSDRVLSRAPKAADPTPAINMSLIESVVGQLSAKTNQSQTQPSQPIPSANPAPAPPQDLSAILTALNVGQGQQASLSAPVSTIPAAAPPQPVPIDLNALLSTLQKNGAQPNSSAALPFPSGFPQWSMQFPPQMDSGLQQVPPPQQHHQLGLNNTGGIKRQRDDGNSSNNDRGHGSFKKHKNGRPGLPHKVLACKFWPLGKCTKGDDCTFIHDQN